MSVKRNSTYTVTLTRKQAYTLYRLLKHIGGNPDGPRGELQKLQREMECFIGDFEDEPSITFVDPYDTNDTGRSPAIYIEKGE